MATFRSKPNHQMSRWQIIVLRSVPMSEWIKESSGARTQLQNISCFWNLSPCCNTMDFFKNFSPIMRPSDLLSMLSGQNIIYLFEKPLKTFTSKFQNTFELWATWRSPARHYFEVFILYLEILWRLSDRWAFCHSSSDFVLKLTIRIVFKVNA